MSKQLPELRLDMFITDILSGNNQFGLGYNFFPWGSYDESNLPSILEPHPQEIYEPKLPPPNFASFLPILKSVGCAPFQVAKLEVGKSKPGKPTIVFQSDDYPNRIIRAEYKDKIPNKIDFFPALTLICLILGETANSHYRYLLKT